MKIAVLLGVTAGLLLAGCATTRPKDILVTTAPSVIATAFAAELQGQNVGTTVFQNRYWVATPEDFAPNTIALVEIRDVSNQSIPVVDGNTATPPLALAAGTSEAALVACLVALGHSQQVSRVLLLDTTTTKDWIGGTNQSVHGLGLYRREVFGLKRYQAYAVVRLRVFDCATRRFVATDVLPGARGIEGVEWHEKWEDFPEIERRRVIRVVEQVLREQVGAILTRAGLADLDLNEPTLGQKLLFRPNRPKSSLPEGNRLEIPQAVSQERARQAVKNGLTRRGWSVVSETESEIVGVYRDGKKEAGVVASVSADTIELTPNDYEIAKDDSRTAVKPYQRWQNNLKASIFQDLLRAEENAALPAANP